MGTNGTRMTRMGTMLIFADLVESSIRRDANNRNIRRRDAINGHVRRRDAINRVSTYKIASLQTIPWETIPQVCKQIRIMVARFTRPFAGSMHCSTPFVCYPVMFACRSVMLTCRPVRLNCRSVRFARCSIKLAPRSARFAHCSVVLPRCSVKFAHCSAKLPGRSACFAFHSGS